MAGVCEECGLCRPRMKRCARCRGEMYWFTYKKENSSVIEEELSSCQPLEKLEQIPASPPHTNGSSRPVVIDEPVGETSMSSGRSSSKDCQEKHWLTHKLRCSELPETKESACLPEGTDKDDGNDLEKQEQANHFVIKMKNKHGKSEVRVAKSESGEEMFLFLCQHLKTPPEKIRLISRGKLITKENISPYIADGAIFQAFGEESEDETGLDVRDIEVLMAQLSVGRNVAIKALRRTGDLIDAFLYVSDNQ